MDNFLGVFRRGTAGCQSSGRCTSALDAASWRKRCR